MACEMTVIDGVGKETKAEELLAGLGSSPGERDREIYEAVCIMGRSATAVAREFRLAQETQRKLARRQHELDRRTTREALQHYYDIFAMQVDELHDAWRASREESETIQRTTRPVGWALPTCLQGGSPPSAADETASQPTEGGQSPPYVKEATTVRPQRVEFRCLSLANRIVRDMRAIETEYRYACEREEAAITTRSVSEGAPPSRIEACARPGLAHASGCEPRAVDRELEALKASLPPLAPGERREFVREEGGPWQAKTLPPRGPGRMSRRERNLLEREKAIARGRQETSQARDVSAATQAPGGPGVATRHVAP